MNWLETNSRVLSKLVWDSLVNHRWKNKKFHLSLAFPEGKKTEKENQYLCLERNRFQIIVCQLFQMALLVFNGTYGIFKRSEENRWGFSFPDVPDSGRRKKISLNNCSKYVGHSYHLTYSTHQISYGMFLCSNFLVEKKVLHENNTHPKPES